MVCRVRYASRHQTHLFSLKIKQIEKARQKKTRKKGNKKKGDCPSWVTQCQRRTPAPLSSSCPFSWLRIEFGLGAWPC